MWYLIIGVIVGAIAVLVVAFLAFSWVGVLAVFGIVALVGLLYFAGKAFTKVLREHDENAKEIAKLEGRTGKRRTKKTVETSQANAEQLYKEPVTKQVSAISRNISTDIGNIVVQGNDKNHATIQVKTNSGKTYYFFTNGYTIEAYSLISPVEGIKY